jgi:hypothetical protein
MHKMGVDTAHACDYVIDDASIPLLILFGECLPLNGYTCIPVQGAHHLDLMFSHPDDPQSVIDARKWVLASGCCHAPLFAGCCSKRGFGTLPMICP